MGEWFESVSSEVVGGLILAGILAALAIVRIRVRRSRKQHVATTKASKSEAGAERVQVLREQVREVARARGLTLADRSEGSNPVVVTFTDGRRSWFYRDHPTYTRDAHNGRCDPTRARVRKPPLPVSRWGEATLEKWLADNAD